MKPFLFVCRRDGKSESYLVRSILLSVHDMDVQGLDVVATVGQLDHNTEYVFVVKHNY